MENIILPALKQTAYSGQKVLSTFQLAALLKCKRNNITDNFRNHKADFIEGVDYFFVAGDELKALRLKDKAAQTGMCAFSKYSTNTYLWTLSGVEKISKIIGTDEAKLFYISLKIGYFEMHDTEIAPAPKTETPQISPREKLEYLKFLILNCTDENLRDSLIKSALELLD